MYGGIRMSQAASDARCYAVGDFAAQLPISVIVAARNEAANIGGCLEALRNCDQVVVVDSQSTDGTLEIAQSFGATVVQFFYQGGWPKKRQWALDALPLRNEWILLLDADEILTAELAAELYRLTEDARFHGYFIPLQMEFLGHALRHGDAEFSKLSFFRRGKGRFECRLRAQDSSMADMEVHEHVVVNGNVGRTRNALLHRNVNSLSRYISKHNEYSNWEAHVLTNASRSEELPASLRGNQAQRRRWIKRMFYRVPGAPLLLFLYKYLFRLGILDGVPGLIYCAFQAIQLFHTKAKIYELKLGSCNFRCPVFTRGAAQQLPFLRRVANKR